VRSGQLEAGGGVIKGGIGPQDRVVASVASQWERCRNVVHRSGRVVVVGLVTGDAGRAGQAVIIVDVTIRASTRRHGMRTSQRKSYTGVVEGRVQPVGGVMTGVAGLREVRADVVRIGRALEILQVAVDAGRAGQAVIVVDVAIGTDARRNRMQAGERESRVVVVEGRIEPVGGVVAGIAGLREVRRHVVGIRGALEVLQVAVHAGPTV